MSTSPPPPRSVFGVSVYCLLLKVCSLLECIEVIVCSLIEGKSTDFDADDYVMLMLMMVMMVILR